VAASLLTALEGMPPVALDRPDLPLGMQVATGPRLTVVDAALRCIARYGVNKTTLDDVAREAGCSRATIYRAFPGGKDALGEAVIETEVARLFESVARRLAGVGDLEELLVAAMDEVVERISAHRPLQFLIQHEPEVILPRVAFSAFDTVLAVAAAFLAPYLAPWLEVEDARRVGEWVTRIVMSYLLCPPAIAGSRDGSHRPDEAYVRHLVQSFVLPGIRVLQTSTSD
jgi:AcrR family transcriptional regulator